MEPIWALKNGDAYKDPSKNQNQRDIITQSVSLYAARKRQKNAASILPELPDTFFGWLPALYRITEDEILASAGLDAFVVSGL